MSYIAKTDGGQTILDFRLGALTDIDEADRANWRAVSEVRPSFDGVFRFQTVPTFEITDGGATVALVWTVGEPPAAWSRWRLTMYAADKRWHRQQAGTTIGGIAVDTSDASQAKIHQALSVLEKGWVSSIDFKSRTRFVAVDLATITAIAQAVAAHVQGCFTAEKACIAAINAGTVTTTSDVDDWPWP